MLGRVFGPGFWLALSGTLLATGMMVAAWRWGRRWLGPVGVSLLGAAGHVTGQVSAAMASTAAPFSIQSLEPVEAICFHYGDLLEAARENLEMAQLFRRVLAEAFIRNEQREALLLTCNAEQRYQWLMEHEPYLLQRVAQFHIASYLGVDAVTLSRLKRKFRQ